MFITKYGSLFGTVPPTTGRVFFVSPTDGYVIDGQTFSASDDNDGLSPQKALRTIARFVVLATANAGETAILLEGDHSVGATPVGISKAGLTILGLHSQHGKSNRLRKKATVTGTDHSIFDVYSDDFELGYVEVRNDSRYSGITFGTEALSGRTVDGLYIHDCVFRLGRSEPNPGTGTAGQGVGINFGARRRYVAATAGMSVGVQFNTDVLATGYIEDCVFIAEGRSGPGIVLATCQVHMKGNRFIGATAWNTAINVATNASACLLEDSVFTAQYSWTVPILANVGDAQTHQGSIYIRNCDFGLPFSDARKPLDGFVLGTNFGGTALWGGNCFIMTATGARAMFKTATLGQQYSVDDPLIT